MATKRSDDENTARAIIERCGKDFSATLTAAVRRAREGLDPVIFTASIEIEHPPNEVSYTFGHQAKPKAEKSEATSIKLEEGPLTREAEAAAEKKAPKVVALPQKKVDA